MATKDVLSLIKVDGIRGAIYVSAQIIVKIAFTAIVSTTAKT
jgi:hypothetical protein